MSIGQQIKAVRKRLSLTQQELAQKANMSRSYLADVERDRYNPSISTLETLADAMGVSLDRLTGEAAISIIETKLDELNMAKEELAKKANLPVMFLERLDHIQPQEWDYISITKVARALGLDPVILRTALARQEPPVYDGPYSTTEEDFYVEEDTDIIEDKKEPEYYTTTKEDYKLLQEIKAAPPEVQRTIEQILGFMKGKK